MRDWRTIMEDFSLYDPARHMKTEHLYSYPSGSYMEFFSVDNAAKVRGPGRDILFLNEANIVSFETFRQLLIRTKKCIFIDYNPADEFHWIYDKVLTRPDCKFIQSTYLDNPFLPIEQVREIESYRETDENFWNIYGLGERGHSEGVIFTHWQMFNEHVVGNTVYGLDFGYNNPCALVEVTDRDKNLYVKELIYQSKLTTTELVTMLKDTIPLGSRIFADHEPDRIAEINAAGFNCVPANKDVKTGIDFLKSRKLYIHAGSVNALKEIKSYKYKSKLKIEDPVKLNDHAMDAMRYGAIALKDTGPSVGFPSYPFRQQPVEDRRIRQV